MITPPAPTPRLLPPVLRERRTPEVPDAIDVRIMRRALELARAGGELGEAPIGAVVYRHATGEILAEAHNLRERDADPVAHAEVLAIRAAARARGDWRLGEFSLAVTLEPCCMCAGAIVLSRLGRVVYGADDPKAGAARSLFRLLDDPRLNHRVTPVRGVLGAESAALLRSFFRARR